MSSEEKLKQIVEAALLAAGRPLNLDQLQALFDEREQPEKKQLREVLESLMEDYRDRGIEVIEVGNGFRIQVRAGLSSWVSRLWTERPPKYSRALLETLALIAYRQPITRGEIEDIRGVSVSSNIIKTLTEREWVRVVGHRDVPGKPALYATTKEFLDYFNLRSLNELPTLAEIRDLESINRELELSNPDRVPDAGGEEGGDAETDDRVITLESEHLSDEAPASDAGEGGASGIGEDRDESAREETVEEPSGETAEESDEARVHAHYAETVAEDVDGEGEAADNIIEFDSELKKTTHEQE